MAKGKWKVMQRDDIHNDGRKVQPVKRVTYCEDGIPMLLELWRPAAKRKGARRVKR